MTPPVPLRLAARPVDERGYVIPYVTSTPNDRPDFRAIDNDRRLECAKRGLCGLCAVQLDYWKAFVGGTESSQGLMYNDPPMHVECAEYALAVCPYLAIRDHPRAQRYPDDVHPAVGHTDDKPDVVVIVIARRYKMAIPKKKRASDALFHAQGVIERREYRYDNDGQLVLVTNEGEHTR